MQYSYLMTKLLYHVSYCIMFDIFKIAINKVTLIKYKTNNYRIYIYIILSRPPITSRL